MKVIIQSNTLKVTEALRIFIQKQIRKLARCGQKIQQVTVYLDCVKRKKNAADATTVQFQITTAKNSFVVKKQAHDMYVAISEVADRATRLLREKRHKYLDNKRKISPKLKLLENFDLAWVE